MRRGLNGLCDVLAELDLDARDAENLGEQMKIYVKRHAVEYAAAMDVPEFRKMWEALDSAVTQSQERARILEAAEEIQRHREHR